MEIPKRDPTKTLDWLFKTQCLYQRVDISIDNVRIDLMGRNNRKFIRAAVPCKLIIRFPKENTFSTHTENIGEGGIRVKIEKRLVTSSVLGLEIYIKNEKIISEGKVTYTLNLGENPLCYATGIEFYNIKEKDRFLINNFIDEVIAEK